MQKHAKLEKGCVFGHINKFWKGHDGQIKRNACKNTYLGYIFIPEKYMFRVCFKSPFTRMISSLKYKCPLPQSISLWPKVEEHIKATQFRLVSCPREPLECQEGVSGLSKNSGKKGNFSQSSTVHA